jgi:hypothetical protein
MQGRITIPGEIKKCTTVGVFHHLSFFDFLIIINVGVLEKLMRSIKKVPFVIILWLII